MNKRVRVFFRDGFVVSLADRGLEFETRCGIMPTGVEVFYVRRAPMIDDQEHELDDRLYRWEYSPTAGAQVSWVWMDARTHIQPPNAVHERLKRVFIQDLAPRMARNMKAAEWFRLEAILRSMGATGPEINRILRGSDPSNDGLVAAEKDRSDKMKESLGQSPFEDPTIRDWFFLHREKPGGIPHPISIIGNGPFEKRDLSDFFATKGIVVRPVSKETTVIVVGTSDWTKGELDRLIDDREDGALRIYSQQMYLAYMATSNDPFTGLASLLEAFKKGHPALEFVASGWTGWVRPFAVGSGSGDQVMRRVDRSPLKKMGYAVGAAGLARPERQAILGRAFFDVIPYVDGPEYMAAWGDSRSETRLRRIAEHLAFLSRDNCGRQERAQAVIDWNLDLEWLKSEFYIGHFRFHWPDTEVFSH